MPAEPVLIDSPPSTVFPALDVHEAVTVHAAGGLANRGGGSPVAAVRSIWRNRHLIAQLTRRDVLSRYRGSYLGVLWSVLSPLAMLSIFAVVFGVILEGRFTGHPSESRVDFALQLFAGLSVFNAIAECLIRSPSLMLMNTNYVTKVVFPVEILPVVVVLNAFVNLLFALVPLLLGIWIFRGYVPVTALLWPLLAIPTALLSLGLTWFLSALGVFFRDLAELMGPLTQVLIFSSAIFYPIERVPAAIQPALRLNPLAFLAEQSRNLLVWGVPLNWGNYAVVLAVGFVFAAVGYAVFNRVKHAFADVL